LFKEDPEKAKNIIAQWKAAGQSKEQEWIIKHGMRNQK
jgi:3-methyladenine DNA glycosylase AlkC